MYRVVTVRYLRQGLGRKRVISKGPLHPSVQQANVWADYLRQAGDYYEVRVETGSSAGSARLHGEQDGSF